MTYYESLTPRSPDYRVFVTPEGGSRTELSVTCAWQHQPGSFNYDTELESAASWVWSGKALVEVEAVNPSIVLQNVVIRPRKAGIVPAVLPERRLVSFAVDASLAAHRILSVEIDGIARPLFLFTDPPLEAPEDLLSKTPGADLVYAPPAGSDSDVLTAEDICALSREHSVLVFRKGIYNLEPFILKKDGPFTCRMSNVEVMGRDVSVVATNEASENPIIRAIIDTDSPVDAEAETVRFAVKPNKIFLFSKETEERIPADLRGEEGR